MTSFKKQLSSFLIVFLISICFNSPAFSDCRDVSCRNPSKKGKCQRGLVTQEFCNENGPDPCCCSPKQSYPSICKVIGCSRSCEKCLKGQSIVSILINNTSPLATFSPNPTYPAIGLFGGNGADCCCPNGIANIEAITCRDAVYSHYNRCQELNSATEPMCSSNQRVANFDIYLRDESQVVSSSTVSSSSGCPIPVSPGVDCDVGTLERTISCCCGSISRSHLQLRN